MGHPEQHNLSQSRRRFPTGIGKSTGQASSCTLISHICEVYSKLMLEVAMENLSCYLPCLLAQNQTLPTSGGCKAYVACGAYDSLSSPPFLPFGVVRVRPGLPLALAQLLKVLGVWEICLQPRVWNTCKWKEGDSLARGVGL